MDTKPQPPTQAKPEIPNFKLAKVGEKRERKKGGLPWLPATGAGSKLTLASVLGCKAGVLGLIGVLSATAISYNNDKVAAMNAAGGAANSKVASIHRPRADYEGDLSNLPKDPNARARGDGMSMVSGSLDGKTPEQRAAEAAAAAEKARLEEEARAKAEAEAQAKADAEAAQAQAQADAAGAAVPPGQADASAAAPGSGSTGLGGGRIGSLSSGGSGGGGLSGGSGLSGGITKGFDSAKFGGGSGRAGDFKGSNKAGRTSATPGRGGRAQNLGRVRGRGISDKGLNRVAGLSRQAQAGNGETSAAASQSAFDGMRGGGSAITGAGAGAGGSPAGGGSGGNTGSGGGGGGGTQSQPTPFTPPDTTSNVPTTTCGAGTHIENGVCMPDKGKNVSEWQTLVDTAWDLLKYAGYMMLLAMALGLLAKAIPAWGAVIYTIAKWVSYIAAVLFGAAAVLGLYISIKHGQWSQGLLITALGGIGVFFALRAADSAESKAAEAEAEAEMSETSSEVEDFMGEDEFGGDEFGDEFGGDEFGGDEFGGEDWGGEEFGGDEFSGGDSFEGNDFGDPNFDWGGDTPSA